MRWAGKGDCIQEDFSLTLGITGFGAGAPFPKLLWRHTYTQEREKRLEKKNYKVEPWLPSKFLRTPN